MGTVTRHYIDGRYGQLHLRRAGPSTSDRPALVCLHMSPKSGRSYQSVLPLLAAGRVVLAPDYPGMGESDPPPAEPPVSIEDYARSMFEAADAMGVTAMHVAGHHTGAMVAAEMAAMAPARVISVISISAPLFSDAEAAALDAHFSPLPLDEAGTRFTTLWQRVLAHRGPGMTLQMAAQSFAENLRGGENYEWGHRAAFAYVPRYREQLAAIRQPVLVINPKDDCWEISPRADALLHNGRRIDCPQWGHGFLDAFAHEASALMLDFIAAQERS